MALTLSSPDFDPNKAIPTKFTCEGTDSVPTLLWENVPDNTKSLAIIMDDPDAANGTWVHWVLFNISPTIQHLSAMSNTPNGAINGTNSWGKTGYYGPCPPSGQHRYFFKIYALDTMLNLTSQATKKDLESAMQDHIIAQAELMGVYQKGITS